MTRIALFGDPTKALGTVAEAECARVVAAIDLAETAVGAGRVVRLVLGRNHFDGQRHREHGLGVSRAAPDHHLHPGRRRDQRHRRGHQCRRPAVLERRSDDADAHQGHPGHDPRQRDGADRQAIPGLLRWGFGRGQLRHRRLRPRDGTQRSSPILGAEPARRLRHPLCPLRPRVRRPGERFPRRADTSDPADRDVRAYPHVHPASEFTHRRRHLLRGAPTKTARNRSTSAP